MSLTFERTDPIQKMAWLCWGHRLYTTLAMWCACFTASEGCCNCLLHNNLFISTSVNWLLCVALCSVPQPFQIYNLWPLESKLLFGDVRVRTSYAWNCPIPPCFSSEPINSWQRYSLSVVTDFALRKMGKSCRGFMMPCEVWMWLHMRSLPGFSVIRRS